MRSWRGVALAGDCPGLGRLAWPTAAPNRQLAKLRGGGNFAEELPLLQGIQA